MAVVHTYLSKIFNWDFTKFYDYILNQQDTYIIACGIGEKMRGSDVKIRELLTNDPRINLIYESPWCHNRYQYHKNDPYNRQKVFIFELKDTVESNPL